MTKAKGDPCICLHIQVQLTVDGVYTIDDGIIDPVPGRAHVLPILPLLSAKLVSSRATSPHCRTHTVDEALKLDIDVWMQEVLLDFDLATDLLLHSGLDDLRLLETLEGEDVFGSILVQTI